MYHIRNTFFFVLSVIFNVVRSDSVRSQSPFADVAMKPVDDANIELITNVPVQAACMIKCNVNDQCMSFVYDDVKRLCTLYETDDGVLPLASTEKAVKHMDRCLVTFEPTCEVHKLAAKPNQPSPQFDREGVWRAFRRRYPSRIDLRIGGEHGNFLYSFKVFYGSDSYWVGVPGNTTDSMVLGTREMITKVTTYDDSYGTYFIPWKSIVGIEFATNLGKVYGPFGQTASTVIYTFVGQRLLYFHGNLGSGIDAIGASFEC